MKFSFELLYDNNDLWFGETYEVVMSNHTRWTGTFLGVKCSNRDPDTIHLYFLFHNIGEMGININDIEQITHE